MADRNRRCSPEPDFSDVPVIFDVIYVAALLCMLACFAYEAWSRA